MDKYLKGFTLIELLITTFIIIIAGVIILYSVNLKEISKRGRDSVRLADFSDIEQAINAAVSDSKVNKNITLCSNNSYPCSGKSNRDSNLIDGTGWIKVSLKTQQGFLLSVLPVDPINNSANHYSFCASNLNGNYSWEIATVLESNFYKSRMTQAGGDNSTLYKLGSNYNLINSPTGMCIY